MGANGFELNNVFRIGFYLMRSYFLGRMAWCLVCAMVYGASSAASLELKEKEKEVFMQTRSSWTEFNALLPLVNEDYEVARNKLLDAHHPFELKERLLPYLRSTRWEERLQAYILLAWVDKRWQLQEFLRHIDSEAPNIEHLSKSSAYMGYPGIALGEKYAMVALKDFSDQGLALAWEVIWKRFETWPRWKIETFEKIINILPKDEFSVGMGFIFLQNYQSNDVIRGMLETVEMQAQDLPVPVGYEVIDILESRPIQPIPRERRVSSPLVRDMFLARLNQELRKFEGNSGINNIYFKDLTRLKIYIDDNIRRRQGK